MRYDGKKSVLKSLAFPHALRGTRTDLQGALGSLLWVPECKAITATTTKANRSQHR